MPAHVGTVVRTTDAAQLDRICSSGLDWLMLDGEHASVDLDVLDRMLHMIDGRLRCYVRVPSLDSAWVGPSLSWGAEGIVFPNIDTSDQALEAVRRVHDSRWPLARVVIQGESASAVANIASIATTPGVDWLLIGPNDLSASLGIPGRFDLPAYTRAVATIERGCRSAGLPIGIYGATPEVVEPYEGRGYEWVLVGIDRPF